jgi:hypothetical protein
VAPVSGVASAFQAKIPASMSATAAAIPIASLRMAIPFALDMRIKHILAKRGNWDAKVQMRDGTRKMGFPGRTNLRSSFLILLSLTNLAPPAPRMIAAARATAAGAAQAGEAPMAPVSMRQHSRKICGTPRRGSVSASKPHRLDHLRALAGVAASPFAKMPGASLSSGHGGFRRDRAGALPRCR